MPTITIDNQDYDLDSLSDDAKNQLQMLQFVDAELQRLGAQTAVLKTARIGYGKALIAAVQAPNPVVAGDTIKFT